MHIILLLNSTLLQFFVSSSNPLKNSAHTLLRIHFLIRLRLSCFRQVLLYIMASYKVIIREGLRVQTPPGKNFWQDLVATKTFDNREIRDYQKHKYSTVSVVRLCASPTCSAIHHQAPDRRLVLCAGFYRQQADLCSVELEKLIYLDPR